MILSREPVAIAAALRAVLLAVMAFGVGVSGAQLAAVMLAVEAVLALVTRARVTPTANDAGVGDGGYLGDVASLLVILILLVILLRIFRLI